MTDTPLICIAYFSGAGHTARLAEHIAEGVSSAATRLVDVTQLTETDWQALDQATAIVFGCPTYMGSTAARFDAFLEEAAATRWPDPGWIDKLAAGFTVASHPSGDKLVALQRIQSYAAQMGMIWVGQTSVGAPIFPERQGLNRDGAWTGLMATSSPDRDQLITEGDARTAKAFGQRIEMAAQRWHRA